jgi:hypothetical protein
MQNMGDLPGPGDLSMATAIRRDRVCWAADLVWSSRAVCLFAQLISNIYVGGAGMRP